MNNYELLDSIETMLKEDRIIFRPVQYEYGDCKIQYNPSIELFVFENCEYIHIKIPNESGRKENISYREDRNI